MRSVVWKTVKSELSNDKLRIHQMFVCLSVVLRDAWEYFAHMETVNIASKELQNFADCSERTAFEQGGSRGDPEFKKKGWGSSPLACCKRQINVTFGVNRDPVS